MELLFDCQSKFLMVIIDYSISKKPRPGSILAGFAQGNWEFLFSDAELRSRVPSAKAASRAGFRMFHVERCTKFGHPPVDGLHSIDFTRDKAAGFYLTLKLKGVKRHSFFDNF